MLDAASYQEFRIPRRLVHRRTRSHYEGPHAGKWPFRYDPDDLSTLYFQDPQTNQWCEVPWLRRDELDLPFSEEALIYARKASKDDDLPFDEVVSLSNLLGRWNAGLHQNVAERRMAIRADIQRQPLNKSRFQIVDDSVPVAVQRALNLRSDSQLLEDDLSDDDYLDESPESYYSKAMEIMR